MVPDASIAFAAVTLMASNAGGDHQRGHGRGWSPKRLGNFTQKLHLELPKGGEDMENQSAGRAGGVDVLVQRYRRADAACRQGVHGCQKLADGSR
jgi:hypothetical protein